MTLDSAPALPASTAAPNRALGIVILGIGGLLLAVSACALVGFIVAPLVGAQDVLSINTTIFSLSTLLLAFGGLLVYLGRGLVRDTLSATFTLPPPLLLFGLLLGVLVVGEAILVLDIAPAYLFPLWHVLTSVLFPLALLSFLARRLAPVSAASVLASFAWGGLGAILLVLVVELVLIVLGLGLVLVATTLLIGVERLNELVMLLQASRTDTDRLTEILAQEPGLLVIGGIGIVIFLAIVIPLVEETIKSTGPALLIRRGVRARLAPTRSATLLWGLAAGAGFAFTENMFNGQNSLTTPQSLLGFWPGAMLLRAGTSILHMTATATVAVGWYQALVGHKFIRLALLFLAAVGLHGMWNGAALLLAGGSAMTQQPSQPQFIAYLLLGIAFSILALLLIICLFWLRTLVRWAHRSPNISDSRDSLDQGPGGVTDQNPARIRPSPSGIE